MKCLNPYLDLHRELCAGPGLSGESLGRIRKKLIWAFAFAVPDDRAIEALSSLGPLLEGGAGTGYWAWLCAQSGIDVVAYDRNPLAPPRWFDVRYGDAQMASLHPERALFLCWPPNDDPGPSPSPSPSPMCERWLSAYNGTRFAYVGEYRGRTGTPEFHSRLEREWNLEAKIPIPVWPGFTDALYLFKRS